MSDSPDQSSTGDLVPYVGADAATTREGIVRARVELERRKQDIARTQAEQRAELDRQRKELEAKFNKMRAELDAQMKPLQEQLAKMVEVMWTVDLYLGRDETLRLVRDGTPAPVDTPITLRQKVLVMAEESLILMEKGDTGVDADGIPHFIAWLCADDAHLDRVLPEPKGVVVLIPTRVQSRTGNAWEDAGRNEANQQSYWLLRNGEKLYVLTVDDKLRIRDRVLPRRREFVDVFDRTVFGFGGTREPVRPGSDEWFELEKVADARRRHYMRIMLVLQGIVDRTPVWHPLPPSGASFLSIADQDAGKIQLIQDDEDSIQLGELGETFAQYQARLNALLRPGLRVIGDWRSEGFRELYERGESWRRGGHPRLFPQSTDSRPEAGVPHLIEGRRDGGFVIRFDRSETVFRRDVPVPGKPGYVYSGTYPTEAKNRASCVIMPGDDWVLPLDLVTVPELEKFLASREERSKHFLSMVPVIRAALAAKKAEAAEEVQFRGLLVALIVAEGADAADATAIVDDLVHWWKVSHTWTTPLNGDGEHEAKAAKQIVAEYRSRQRAAADASEATVIAAGMSVAGAIAVARDRQGRWHVYAPSAGAHEPGVFLDVTRIRRDGTLGESKQWQILPTRTAAALQVVWQDEAWAAWQHGQNRKQRLSEPERAVLVDEMRARAVAAGHTPICVTEFFDPNRPDRRSLHIYAWAAPQSPTETPAEETANPFDWRRGEDQLVRRLSWYVDTSGETPVLGGANRSVSRVSSKFGGFSVRDDRYGYRGDIPWWPDAATRYSESRPRLVWLDETLLAEMDGFLARCAELDKKRRAVRAAEEADAYRYSRPVDALVKAQQLAGVRARFEEDYGRDADDLWESHLATLRLDDPFHPRDTWSLMHSALAVGMNPVGMTLGDLAELDFTHRSSAPRSWSARTPQKLDVGEYGDIVVPEPNSESEETS